MDNQEKSKHTPGPWKAHFWDILDNRSLEPTGKKRMTIEYRPFADISAGRALAELCFENEANARLIAAAPTMYDYIKAKADAGDSEAIKIVEVVNANT